MKRKYISTKFKCLIIPVLFAIAVNGQELPQYKDATLSTEDRVEDLIDRLTTEEKISLFGFDHKGIERLGIPAYNWWNEALHGVARGGSATIFPQAIALAATFNDSLINKVAEAISTEARAKHNLAVKLDRRLQYLGLTFWSPNINIFRDPRWGRGQETYGEDPYLTAQMGKAFVQGLQGDHPNYLRAAAGAKHFAVHSGPEADRHTFNAIVDNKDLRETYLYAFEKLVTGTNLEAIMCAYNRVNGQPCCTGNFLLNEILREEWKFDGHVVTDCWALEDIWLRHKVIDNSVETAAAAIKAGVNLDCSYLLQTDLQAALDQKLITESDMDAALRPTLRTWFRLGFFDKRSDVPYNTLGEESVRSTKHLELSRIAAQQSMVLLKNDSALLPLNKEDYRSMLVIGTNAASSDVLMANYHGVSPNMVTFLEGIVDAAGPATAIQYYMGSDYNDTTRFSGIWVAKDHDVTIAVIGMSPAYEGEGGDAFLAPNGGDKANLSLPKGHLAFMKELRESHDKPIVAVVTGGGAMDIKAIEPYADAIIMAWYPGEQGGNALADILFGEAIPSGRLPVTFYNSIDDLPPYEDYSMEGRTYRYFRGEAQYPFGFGLSYTSYDYKWQKKPNASYQSTDTVVFSITVENTGSFNGNEVVQVYIEYPKDNDLPLKELKAFKNVAIAENGEKKVDFKIPVQELRKWDNNNDSWTILKGTYTIYIGGHSDDRKIETKFSIKK